MTAPEEEGLYRVPLSRSQQNLYNGVLQAIDPALYFVGKSYRLHRLELSKFLAALEATILNNPVQLCVLEASSTEVAYPDLVPRLRFRDLVRVRSDDECQLEHDDNELAGTWSSDILAKPLVRYTVRTDKDGCVSGMDVHTHHILLDGGATGIIEADLARYLAGNRSDEMPCITEGLTKLAEAHRRETARVEESSERLADVVRRELADEAHHGGLGQGSDDVPGAAAKGVLHETVEISGSAYDAILNLSEVKQVPLNVLVAAATVAVDASVRQSTETLLVHAVDNRFGDRNLNVATCLVNSVAHTIRFPPFASVDDVVRTLDRGYVKAVRRRWLREEQYRRMYLAINRTSHVEALTLNFIREAYAPQLRPFLSEAPVATDIGPVEGMTVACIHDEEQRALNLAIWNRADRPARKAHVAERIAAVLESMSEMWDNPIAMTVDEWFLIGPEGVRCQGDSVPQVARPPAPAWFLDLTRGVSESLERRRYVYPWVGWLLQNDAAPGDVLVFADDTTDKSTDLLIACHLAGCGYSVCDSVDEVTLRAEAITVHGEGYSARTLDVAAAHLVVALDDEQRKLVDGRIEQTTRDPSLATKTAYIMPTSGSTGRPKLVRISHGSLALFCAAVRDAYGWGPHDTILQCAPLTSDISVEEVFVSAVCGSELTRSTAMKRGDLESLVQDLATARATIADLPTAVWHLLCEDRDALEALGRSHLRQIVIGGEAIRSRVVDKWIESAAAQKISLVSTYGPTETTVVVTHLPIDYGGTPIAGGARRRLGRPITANSVFVAFGEVVIVGELVSSGYLGIDDRGFGAVMTSDGVRRRAFATADRVAVDGQGFPVFCGRKDAIVKVSGKRVDTAEVTRRISHDITISDVAVELHAGSLGVWFETQPTREGAKDDAAAARIRLILLSLGVSSFFVVGVPNIPRKPNGKVDSDGLRTIPQFVDGVGHEAGAAASSVGLAGLWSRHLTRHIRPDSSLLEEGIGSLDLIRILPDTRNYLGRHISLLDLISADTASNLVSDLAGATPTASAWMDVDTAAEIDHDLSSVLGQRASEEILLKKPLRARQAIVVLGASGILGTGFAQAVLDLKRSGALSSQVVFVTRSPLPEANPWDTLREIDGIQIEYISPSVNPRELGDLIRDFDTGSLVNCIGNTNVVVPYRELRSANVQLVSTIAGACASHGTRMVHLSTFVVNANVVVPQVTDPRQAPYPYAASKSLGELVLAASPHELDFTLVRLPRVLGAEFQLRDSADILVSVVDACIALRTYPSIALTEEVTTGRAAAHSILGLLPELGGSADLGRGITVVRGEAVSYAEFLSGYGLDELDAAEWKHRLDQSEWAKRNPRRWSVVDAWVSLGMSLGTRTYAEYLADYPTIALGIESVVEVLAPPQSVRALLDSDAAVAPSPLGRLL